MSCQGALGPLFGFLKGLFHIFAPCECPMCGALGEVLCGSCGDLLVSRGGSFAIKFADGTLDVLYGGFHRGIVRDVVHLFKYRHWALMARRAGEALGRRFPPVGDALVPVPLHIGSRRGYNQCALLAKGISSIWGVPVVDGLVWRAKVSSQVGSLDRRLPDGAMEWIYRGSIGGVVLVDDVLTTGATMRAAAAAIIKGGCDVRGAVVLSLAVEGPSGLAEGTSFSGDHLHEQG